MDTKSVREKSVESEDEGKAEKIQRRIVWNRRMKFPVSACLVQAALIVLLYEFVDYPDEAHTEVIARCDLAKAASASSKVFRNFSNLGFTLNLTSNNNPIPECVQKQESSDVYESRK